MDRGVTSGKKGGRIICSRRATDRQQFSPIGVRRIRHDCGVQSPPSRKGNERSGKSISHAKATCGDDDEGSVGGIGGRATGLCEQLSKYVTL